MEIDVLDNQLEFRTTQKIEGGDKQQGRKIHY